MGRPVWGHLLNRRIHLPLLIFLLFLIQLFDLISFSAEARGGDLLSVSIRAESRADYKQELGAFNIPVISGRILYQIIQDVPSTESATERLATLQSSLLSPVPSMTPNAQQTLLPTSTLGFTTTTPLSSSPTLPASRTPSATATPYASATAIMVPTNTNPPVNPTNPPAVSTPVPQNTKKPHPTHPPHPTKKP